MFIRLFVFLPLPLKDVPNCWTSWVKPTLGETGTVVEIIVNHAGLIQRARGISTAGLRAVPTGLAARSAK